ncbi:hypothetical protein BS47DRAFT_1398617 [Hydnum rufescens UP504]|uniref:Uncharacterized protein n=1 Tax=Hydnum rufescens UP504 TaxID=1448309 RepID=A0A9P6DLZ7_9AGAM|nr:hypothetical protein BS47DRAFT_1398617 [Hydnum rufescens UP504]
MKNPWRWPPPRPSINKNGHIPDPPRAEDAFSAASKQMVPSYSQPVLTKEDVPKPIDHLRVTPAPAHFVGGSPSGSEPTFTAGPMAWAKKESAQVTPCLSNPGSRPSNDEEWLPLGVP